MTDYESFLQQRAQGSHENGFEPSWFPTNLFDFQEALTTWAIRKGRGAIFADCGMGKSVISLTWAENVVRHTGKRVLLLTPPAVGIQMVAEGEKFGIACERSRHGSLGPSASIHLSLYSPPFGGLYQYSSDIEDLSNCLDLDEFLEHYGFIVDEISRVTRPGRLSAVHCTDITSGNSGCDHMLDLPGEIIRLHATRGFEYAGRFHIWKEPLTVRNRTMMKSLAHKTLIEDSTRCSIANADYLLIFRRAGQNAIPVTHEYGLLRYAGERPIPVELLKYRHWAGHQMENRYSQWIWRQYASSFWDDIRLDRVLPHREARDEGDEKHIHPLQLDVIERCVTLYTNPGETVLSPFMGIGSEIYGAVMNGRRGIGVELKASYYRLACLNLQHAGQHAVDQDDQGTLAFETDQVSLSL